METSSQTFNVSLKCKFLFLCDCVCMNVFLSNLVLLILFLLDKKIDLPVVCQYLQCMLSLSWSFILIHMYSSVSHSYRIV